MELSLLFNLRLISFLMSLYLLTYMYTHVLMATHVFRDHDNEHIAVQLVGRERLFIHMTMPVPTSNV